MDNKLLLGGSVMQGVANYNNILYNNKMYNYHKFIVIYSKY